MDFITSFEFNGKEINLTSRSKYFSRNNVFTLITGKNGSGKSRFLARLTNHLIEDINNFYFNPPKSVIAISTTPFDKFPSHKKNDSYTYVGLKNNYSTSNSSKLIDSISKNLIKKHLNSEEIFKNKIPKVLESIGFHNYIKIILKLECSSKSILQFMNNPNDVNVDIYLKDYIKGEVNQKNHIQSSRVYEKIARLTKDISMDDLIGIYEAIRTIEMIKGDGLFSINLSGDIENKLFDNESIIFEESLKTLIKYNFLRASDLKLIKYDYDEMSLRRASSGEQCLIIIMLGIAANIEDRSIILIDEPEVSLHPKWQEEFMPTLMKTFSTYSECQFIIATHSPQIVSGMQGENCFVTDISTQTFYPASFFSGKSADFQLAEIFDSPGQMNEYISRLCFNLLAKLKTHKKLEHTDQIELNHILKLRDKVNKNDPILDLINVLVEVVDHYATNK